MALMDGYFRFLAEELGLVSQKKIAKFLGVTQGRVSQLKSENSLNVKLWRRLLTRIHGQGLACGVADANTRTVDLLNEFQEFTSDIQLAKLLDVTSGAVSQWRNGHALIPKHQVEQVLKKIQNLKIAPLLEMVPIRPNMPGGKWYFFEEAQRTKREKILKALDGRRGVYCYFDGAGVPTYFGKADRTTLNLEAENRLHAQIEAIRYGAGLKKLKKTSGPRQGELVRFLSAYEVTPRSAIPKLEALMIHSAANVLFNKKLEKLAE